MSRQNDEVTGMALAVGLIAMVAYAILLAFAVFAVALCVILTIVSLFAWNKPLKNYLSSMWKLLVVSALPSQKTACKW